ncbi:MAG: Veg family protein [Coriobacteriia bacterium]|nr:Veg family protein [Coriobacteriia bacterium]
MDPEAQVEPVVNPIEMIYSVLKDCIGQTLKVRANLGRSKISEYEGVVTEVHDQLFVVEVKRKRGSVERKSYQYVDVLTGNVVLMFADGDEPLFPQPFVTIV